ncbi:CAP domain-containing protein [uncultured Sphingomonas sp.]|uniref:CAP domain-containing protein n=1 Tax=uncultured Sphingomonas sp. TaxID=158754 RepID=UPI002614811D|nr:CAP domain-containing protein [uncultured Sphingomonas sp.]
MRIPPRSLAALAVAILVTGCGGSDGGGSAGSGIAPPIATPSPTPTATPTASNSWAGLAAALYDVPPNVSACTSGTLKASVKQDFLNRLNGIRALHNLPAVTYSDDEDGQEADSSLMMVLAKQLSHEPDTNWRCYSASGASGAGSSNLVGGWGTSLPFHSEDDYLGLWLTEGGSADIGHRRWILSPFLGKTSYGRVAVVLPDGTRASAASMRVFKFKSDPPVPGGVPPFVAYPYGDYPQRYFGLSNYLSFTAIADPTSSWANQSVSFASATITVTGPSGPMTVTDIAIDNQGYGVPNSLQWRVTGLQAGVSYTVRINGVSGAPQSSYSYSFRVI